MGYILYLTPVICALLIMVGIILAIFVSLSIGLKLIGIAFILYVIYFIAILICIYWSNRW